eukprot:501259_1
MDNYKVVPIPNNERFNSHHQYSNYAQLVLKSTSGNIPLRVETHNKGHKEIESVQYYDAAKTEWCDCVGIESRIIESWMRCNEEHMIRTFIVNIPKNNENTNILNQAIFFDNKLYAFNVMTHQFIKVNILNVEMFTNKTNELFSLPNTRFDETKIPVQQVCHNGRCFMIWKGRLFELKWLYDNEYPTLLTTSHLKWMCSFQRVCSAGPFGIALTMWSRSSLKHWVDEKNDYLIFYEPNKEIVFRLNSQNIQFKEIDAQQLNVENISWSNDTQSITIHVDRGFTLKPIAFEIYSTVLKNMKSRKCKDCYDEDVYAFNISFSEWKPQFDSDVQIDKGTNDDYNVYMAKSMGWYKYKSGFKKLKSGKKPKRFDNEFIPISRAEYLYVCHHASSNYKIIAGVNMEQQGHYNQLKHLQSSKYKILNDFAELGNYLGAVIWYQYNDTYSPDEIGRHIIHTATLIDFQYGFRSSSTINIINGKSVSSSASFEYLDQIAWIGVIDNDNPENQYNKPPISTPSMRYHVPPQSRSQTSAKCGNCGNAEKTKVIKICGGCKQIRYCNEKCQRKNWKQHKSECKKLKMKNEDQSNYFEVTKGRIICSDGGYSGGVEFANVMKGKWNWKCNVSTHKEFGFVPQIIAYHESVQHDEQYTNDWELHKELFTSDEYVYDREQRLHDLPLDSIHTSEMEFQKLKKLLYSIECLQNIVDDMIINEICGFCYFVLSLNWIQQPVLDGKW